MTQYPGSAEKLFFCGAETSGFATNTGLGFSFNASSNLDCSVSVQPILAPQHSSVQKFVFALAMEAGLNEDE